MRRSSSVSLSNLVLNTMYIHGYTDGQHSLLHNYITIHIIHNNTIHRVTFITSTFN